MFKVFNRIDSLHLIMMGGSESFLSSMLEASGVISINEVLALRLKRTSNWYSCRLLCLSSCRLNFLHGDHVLDVKAPINTFRQSRTLLVIV